MTAKNGPGARSVQIYPDAEELGKRKAGLPTFQPHDVTSILELPAAEAKREIHKVTASVIDEQLDQLLNALGLDRSTPDVWQRGFRLLAMIHHRTGHFMFKKPAPPNRNAAKRSPERDRLLYQYVKEIENKDVDETAALRIIANDPEKCRRLGLSSNTRTQTADEELWHDTLRKRWKRINKTAPPGSLLAAVVGDYPVFGSEKDKANWRPNLSELPPLLSRGKSNNPA